MKFINNFKKAYKYSKGSRKYIAIYLIASLIGIVINIVVPIVTAQVMVKYTSGSFNDVIIYAFLFLMLQVFGLLFRLTYQFASEKFSKIVVTKIQTEMGKELLKIKLHDIDATSNGVFIQRIARDATEVAEIIYSIIFYTTSIIASVGALGVIMSINYVLGILYIAFVLINIAYEKYRVERINIKDKEFRDQREKTSGFTTEMVRGIRDIKTLNSEKEFITRFEGSVNDLNQKNYEIFKTYRVLYGISHFFSLIFDFVIIIFIVLFAKNNVITIAKGLIVYNYRYEISSFVFGIREIFDSVRKFNISSERVFSLIDSDEFEKEEFGNKHLNKIAGSFEFKNVSFKYDNNKQVLKNVSFKINPNETVAFVGKSGVGKSTIFSLICRFYDPLSGSIYMDGINIKELDKDTIRSNITVINQDPYIFNTTIKDNFKMFKKNITQKEIESVCKIASIHDFIMTLPKKYNTLLGENGINLSGGQKQRIAIARALIQDTKVILFDEATSALDNETQKEIQEAINNMKGSHTMMIIAHRLSTIKNSDRIIFIHNGKVLKEGTHESLLKSVKEYKELYENELVE